MPQIHRAVATALTSSLLVCLGLGVAPSFSQQRCDTSSYPLSTPTERFEDHGDGTVTDKQSKLMWMRCSAGQSWSSGTCTGNADRRTWQSALEVARLVNERGEFFYNDWRVPQLRELASIAERQCENPRINLALFPDTPAAFYWTVTSRPGNGAEAAAAYVLSFGGDGVKYESKDESYDVRLVRTDQ